ncbi:hypothetical protein B0H11DRAFT_1911795 [Mycena galericulata]|nr:hypothetical protein B0H11DRAFT_1911795 [Mycena galericulata]
MNGVAPTAGLKRGYSALAPLAYTSCWFYLVNQAVGYKLMRSSTHARPVLERWIERCRKERVQARRRQVIHIGVRRERRKVVLVPRRDGEFDPELDELEYHRDSVGAGLLHLAAQRRHRREIILCVTRRLGEAESASLDDDPKPLDEETDLSARLFQPVRRVDNTSARGMVGTLPTEEIGEPPFEFTDHRRG